MRKLTLIAIALATVSCTQKPPEALGTLERDRISHTATAAEVVIALPVRQGGAVTVGTVLVRLDNSLQQARTERARADVAKAEANLDKLRNGARVEEVAAAHANVTGTRANLIEAEQAYKRQKSLILKNLTSQANLDRKRAARNTASATLVSAQEHLRKLTNGTREEDLSPGLPGRGSAIRRCQ